MWVQKNICGGFNNIFNHQEQKLMVGFFVNEKLALELVITVSFQQVKIIRSWRKQLVKDQYLHAGRCSTFIRTYFLQGQLPFCLFFSSHLPTRKNFIPLACAISVFLCLCHAVLSFEGFQSTVSVFLRPFL